MPHAVIITGPGFQDHDVIYTYYRLKEARFDVDIATKEDPVTGHGLHVTGKYGVPIPLDKTAGEPIAFGALAAPEAVRSTTSSCSPAATKHPTACARSASSRTSSGRWTRPARSSPASATGRGS